MRNYYRLYLILLLLFCLSVVTVAYAQSNSINGQFAHKTLFEKNTYPSAKECSSCHVEQYREWSASPHAYAQLSPVFNAMHATLVKQTNGTIGDFCIRCHSPVGMDMGEEVFMENSKRHEVSREGVTCISCHRQKNTSGKSSGRFGINHGDIFTKVLGPNGGRELERVIRGGNYEVNTDPNKQGRNIHTKAEKSGEMTTSSFCGACHDVNAPSGFRLEEAFSEYKSSQAARNKTSCQDCHMGKVPGKPLGYVHKPVAIVGGKPTIVRKHANHMFVGPDYSIVHPGIFPHNPGAQEFATFDQWLSFDYRAGWGTNEFEDTVDSDYKFPSRWQDPIERYEARDFIESNLELLDYVKEERKKLLQAGYKLGDFVFEEGGKNGIKFKVEFRNGTDGHNVPTGFDAERLVFLRVILTDSTGKEFFQSGDLDPNGDLRDLHSSYVHNGELPLDKQLFNLQSKFLVNMIRGGDKESVLNLNDSVTPLLFVRPPTVPTLIIGRERSSRKHRQTIPPLGSRWVNYEISKEELINSRPPYRLTLQIVAGMVPVNLINEILEVGFDYGMSPREVADAVVAGHQILWERTYSLKPKSHKKGSNE